MATKLSIINQTLIALGNPPLSTLESDNAAIQGVISAYDLISKDCIGRKPWSWALRTTLLNEAVGQPSVDPRYQYVYSRPGGLLATYATSPTNFSYILQENFIYANAAPPWRMTYIADVPEGNFSYPFELYVVYRLAAHTAIPLTEDLNKVQLYTQMAEKQLQSAYYLDAQQTPSKAIVFNPYWADHGMVGGI